MCLGSSERSLRQIASRSLDEDKQAAQLRWLKFWVYRFKHGILSSRDQFVYAFVCNSHQLPLGADSVFQGSFSSILTPYPRVRFTPHTHCRFSDNSELDAGSAVLLQPKQLSCVDSKGCRVATGGGWSYAPGAVFMVPVSGDLPAKCFRGLGGAAKLPLAGLPQFLGGCLKHRK